MEGIIKYIGSEYKNSKNIFQSMKRIELVTTPIPNALSEYESTYKIPMMLNIEEVKLLV